MDSQSTVDHLRDESDARKDTTLGDLLDTAAEELDDAQDSVERFGGVRMECPTCREMVWGRDFFAHRCEAS